MSAPVETLRALYTANGAYPVHVVQENGLPNVALTVFANDLRRMLSVSSVRGYVRETLAFVNWCASDPVAQTRRWHWQAEPPQVRHAVRQYLTVAAECRITVRPDTLGLKASYINATAGTRINVGLLLVALKKLYDVLADHRLYGWANPMVHEAARQTMGDVRRHRREAMRAATGRAPMPAISGVDAPPTDLRLSENYFRFVRTQWQPQSIDDPDFPRPWEQVPGLVKPSARGMSRDATFLQREHRYRFLPYEGIYATSLFAHLVVRMQTITGARIGEVQQIAQSPHCITQLVNVGPKSTTRWILRMAPKGRKERADYFIDPDTKDVLLETIQFLRARLHVKKLPIVSHQSPKYAPDRYVIQWNGKALDCSALNTALRFLLHGIALTPDGKGIHLTTHLLRHGCATEMASLHVPADIVARLLHQRHVEVTQYYARPTQQHPLEAAELLFVDRIDVAAEAVRHPKEIGQLLRDAEGQIGALSEVLGGTCVVGDMCPAKFACIGCAGNAPDPDRRDQIDTKRRWAEQQIRWTTEEGLYAERRQMTQLVRDCDVVLGEMSLIAAARKDDRQAIVVRSGNGLSSRK